MQPDQPPTVELLKPGAESSASPAGDVPVTIRAGDDHGLQRLRLEMKVALIVGGAQEGGEKPASEHEPVAMVKQWNDFAGDSTTTAVRHHLLKLKAEIVKPGQTVLIRAVAWDRRAISDWGLELGPQESASGWHAVKIVAEDAKPAAALEQLDKLRGRDLEDFGETGSRPQERPAGCWHSEQLAERTAGAGRKFASNRWKSRSLGRLVQSIGSADRQERLADQAGHEWAGVRRHAPGRVPAARRW